MSRLLIGESQEDLAVAMRDWFSRNQYTVELENNGLRFLELLRQNQYDVIALNIGLAGLDGISIVRSYRASGGSTPILLIAGRHSSHELQSGLDAGADSYLVKPFELNDLAAQLRALLRRPVLRSEKVLICGLIAMDTAAGIVTRNSVPVHLHPMEFKLLQFLLRNPNQVFSAKEIFARVWEKASRSTDDTVRTHIRTLRSKIDAAGSPSVVTTVRGLGYKVENRHSAS